MSLDITAFIKSFPTVLTFVRFNINVYTNMSLKAIALIKFFPTVPTLVKFITSACTNISQGITLPSSKLLVIPSSLAYCSPYYTWSSLLG